MGAILSGAGLAFFAYYGFENLANIAEEAKNPRRTIPLALVMSIAVTTTNYILVTVDAVALVGWEALSSTNVPLALAAEKGFGRAGVIVLSAVALFVTTNTVLMVAASRIIFGMAADGAFPAQLTSIHQRRLSRRSSL